MSFVQDKLPARVRQILAKPGFVAGADAVELRELLGDASGFVRSDLDLFGYTCLAGDLEGALQLLTARSNRPDLTRKQQPLGHTYAAILIFGYGAGRAEFDDKPNDYIKLLDVLLSAGVPVDDPDITGMTALHYAAKWTGTGDLIKVLLKHKATINSQDRFGASPLLIAIRNHTVDVIPVLLDAGASLDVTDAEGSSPRSIYSTRPPEVSNVVKNWLLEHKGKKAALEGDECSKCGTRTASVKRCARCRSRLYCSPECQKVDWKEHKRSCQPFDKEENLLIVTPTYHYGGRTFLSTISTVPSTFGDVRGPTSGRGFETNVRDGKNMVVKIQVPLDVGGLFVYNKKRNFQCFLDYNKNPAAYTRITQIINQKGILGMKAYFAAELRSKDVLAINVAECLPEARF